MANGNYIHPSIPTGDRGRGHGRGIPRGGGGDPGRGGRGKGSGGVQLGLTPNTPRVPSPSSSSRCSKPGRGHGAPSTYHSEVSHPGRGAPRGAVLYAPSSATDQSVHVKYATTIKSKLSQSRPKPPSSSSRGATSGRGRGAPATSFDSETSHPRAPGNVISHQPATSSSTYRAVDAKSNGTLSPSGIVNPPQKPPSSTYRPSDAKHSTKVNPNLLQSKARPSSPFSSCGDVEGGRRGAPPTSYDSTHKRTAGICTPPQIAPSSSSSSSTCRPVDANGTLAPTGIMVSPRTPSSLTHQRVDTPTAKPNLTQSQARPFSSLSSGGTAPNPARGSPPPTSYDSMHERTAGICIPPQTAPSSSSSSSSSTCRPVDANGSLAPTGIVSLQTSSPSRHRLPDASYTPTVNQNLPQSTCRPVDASGAQSPSGIAVSPQTSSPSRHRLAEANSPPTVSPNLTQFQARPSSYSSSCGTAQEPVQGPPPPTSYDATHKRTAGIGNCPQTTPSSTSTCRPVGASGARSPSGIAVSPQTASSLTYQPADATYHTTTVKPNLTQSQAWTFGSLAPCGAEQYPVQSPPPTSYDSMHEQTAGIIPPRTAPSSSTCGPVDTRGTLTPSGIVGSPQTASSESLTYRPVDAYYYAMPKRQNLMQFQALLFAYSASCGVAQYPIHVRGPRRPTLYDATHKQTAGIGNSDPQTASSSSTHRPVNLNANSTPSSIPSDVERPLLKPVLFVPSVHSKVLFACEEDAGKELVRDQEDGEFGKKEEEGEEQEVEEQEGEEEQEEQEEEEVGVEVPPDSDVGESALNPDPVRAAEKYDNLQTPTNNLIEPWCDFNSGPSITIPPAPLPPLPDIQAIARSAARIFDDEDEDGLNDGNVAGSSFAKNSEGYADEDSEEGTIDEISFNETSRFMASLDLAPSKPYKVKKTVERSTGVYVRPLSAASLRTNRAPGTIRMDMDDDDDEYEEAVGKVWAELQVEEDAEVAGMGPPSLRALVDDVKEGTKIIEVEVEMEKMGMHAVRIDEDEVDEVASETTTMNTFEATLTGHEDQLEGECKAEEKVPGMLPEEVPATPGLNTTTTTEEFNFLQAEKASHTPPQVDTDRSLNVEMGSKMQVSEDTVDAEGAATTTTLPVITSTTTEIEDRSDPAAKEDPDPTKTAPTNRTIDVSTLALMLRMFVGNSTSGSQISLPPMDEQTRMKVYGLAPLFGLKCVPEGEGDARYVTVVRTMKGGVSEKKVAKFIKKIAVQELKQLKKVAKDEKKKVEIVGKSGAPDPLARDDNLTPPSQGGKGERGKEKGERGGVPKQKYKDGDKVGKAAPKIDATNVGFRMLTMMGWSNGERIGVDGQGLDAPLAVIMKRTKLGLGMERKGA